MIVVMFESAMARNARSKPGFHHRLRGLAQPHLLLHPLEDQHARVHGHADVQHEARDGGQGEGEAEHGKDGHDEVQVEDVRQHGVQSRPAVVGKHEDEDQRQPERARLDSLADGVLAQGGADRLLAVISSGTGQRAGAQREGEVRGLVELEPVHADLVADGLLDGRLRLDLVVQRNGEDLADVGAGELVEGLPARGVRMKLTVGCPGDRIPRHLGVLDLRAVQPHLFVEDRVALQLVQAVGVLLEHAAQHVALGDDGEHAGVLDVARGVQEHAGVRGRVLLDLLQRVRVQRYGT